MTQTQTPQTTLYAGISTPERAASPQAKPFEAFRVTRETISAINRRLASYERRRLLFKNGIKDHQITLGHATEAAQRDLVRR